MIINHNQVIFDISFIRTSLSFKREQDLLFAILFTKISSFILFVLVLRFDEMVVGEFNPLTPKQP